MTSSVTRTSRLRAGVALATATLALFVLAGCAPDSAPSTAAPTPAATAGETAAPVDTAAPTAAPEPTGTPVSLTCDQVLTADDVYAFNPNYGAQPDFTPADGSKAATAVEYEGMACAWLNQTSGDTFEVSVAQPNDTLMATLKADAVSASKAVPTYGELGFFGMNSGIGTAQLFTGAYWVTVSSVDFIEPGDAQTLMAAVVSHLP